jgi:thiamine transporter 2/3
MFQLVQVLYGGFIAAEVAYYTYIYAKVDKDKFQAVSGHTRAAYLLGRFVSGVLAQILVSTNLMDYRELNFITLGAMFVATVWAFLLPPVQSSIYFHRSSNHEEQDDSKVFKITS